MLVDRSTRRRIGDRNVDATTNECVAGRRHIVGVVQQSVSALRSVAHRGQQRIPRQICMGVDSTTGTSKTFATIGANHTSAMHACRLLHTIYSVPLCPTICAHRCMTAAHMTIRRVGATNTFIVSGVSHCRRSSGVFLFIQFAGPSARLMAIGVKQN